MGMDEPTISSFFHMSVYMRHVPSELRECKNKRGNPASMSLQIKHSVV